METKHNTGKEDGTNLVITNYLGKTDLVINMALITSMHILTTHQDTGYAGTTHLWYKTADKQIYDLEAQKVIAKATYDKEWWTVVHFQQCFNLGQRQKMSLWSSGWKKLNCVEQRSVWKKCIYNNIHTQHVLFYYVYICAKCLYIYVLDDVYIDKSITK